MLFKNEYDFLSNMYPCNITLNVNDKPVTFKCTEVPYQYAKCPTPENLELFQKLNGYEAKKLGRKIKMQDIERFNNTKLEIMELLIFTKFHQHPDLAAKLIAVTEPIVETNYWKDTYWGVCNGIGENHLGKILENIRSQLIQESKK